MPYHKKSRITCSFFLIILFCILIYFPALKGPFALDDFPNLQSLRFVHNFTDAINYASTGNAGTRYLSYLSFTPQAKYFSSNNPFPFKLANLILHIFNGLLIYWFTTFLLKAKNIKNHQILGIIITSLWLIHPIHSNTILYTIQRMNLLSASFVLIGCIYHIVFVEKKNNTEILLTKRQWIKYNCILWITTCLAIISKENGILLLAYVILINHHIKNNCFNLFQRSITLLFPFALLILYLIVTNQLSYKNRDFTLTERLLSQIVILMEYLWKIIIPNFNSFSLFHDDFIKIQTITNPRLLTAFMFWVCLFFISLWLNKVINGFGFGILWFLTGHLIESTIIPLELYFDHRNYLPAYGIIFSSVLLLNAINNKITSKFILGLLVITEFVLIINYLIVLRFETKNWEYENSLALSLYDKSPQSIRAHQYLADIQFNSGQLQDSLLTIHAIEKKFGVSSSNIIQKISINCLINPYKKVNTQLIFNEMKHTKFDNSTTDAMNNLYRLIKNKTCKTIEWDVYRHLTNLILKRKKDARTSYNLTYLLVLSYKEEMKFVSALETSLSLSNNLRDAPYIFLQLDLAIKNNNRFLANQFYKDIDLLNYSEKEIYKSEISNIDIFMKEFLKNEK